ncbi:alpha/beta fold hydrolase [Psychrobacter sanguinis]|uniref:Alpha/beta fold hydrolase n=1 Tax=Psychrobacter sanguinis TaxID=861445 RepID=A0A844M1R1_9GAMM|nr:alpha/beta fold hydrolase [Psychrobacter sanguinis]MUG32882.1 alpha/beta fold hydrolase [Psychrobacter sanguinis]
MIHQTLNLVTTADHQQIAVWKITDNEAIKNPLNPSVGNHKRQNLLLLHGAFSDKGVCLGIASYFASLGYPCFIMEWRGHGSSSQPKTPYHLEDIAFYDVRATLDYLVNELNLDNLHCITHSGGGICLTMLLTRHTEYVDKISSITLFACQAFAAATTPVSYAKLLLSKAATRQMGIVRGKRLKLGTMNESYYLLSQWMDWNLNQNFSSYSPTPIRHQLKQAFNQRMHRLIDKRSGQGFQRRHTAVIPQQPFDYRTVMPYITTPTYAICAAGDSVAPPQGCLKFLQAFNNANNHFREFSIASGDLENYNHTRIFLSRNAAAEVWPTVLNWIEKHSR